MSDQLLVFVLGRSFAISVLPGWPSLLVFEETSCDHVDCPGTDPESLAACTKWAESCAPFSLTPRQKAEGEMPPCVLTLGYALAAVGLIPLCSMNLDDNIRFQVFSFCLFRLACLSPGRSS